MDLIIRRVSNGFILTANINFKVTETIYKDNEIKELTEKIIFLLTQIITKDRV